MLSPLHASAPLGFPDLKLSVPYADAIRYAQFRLLMLPKGELKSFCEQHELPYTSIVGLKNNSLKREEPRLLQRLLRSLAVDTEVIRIPPNTQNARFLFPSVEALTTFQQQLKCFDSGHPPLPESGVTTGGAESPTP
ncbi:hypothetical protein FY528_05265 [Hymenobacter lutimineralis]|uniref:Uncharacterized protein n=1 Tax=Hymenobacter lutimineralis TaxID=2606448 RepID=A0A5D6VBJ0_9BACT|nr:hypothetical protein [Hymenobacter lutimineralis]TYZ12700.1 hypothetical protein FY528_05265 [Hymenobacter lutimineralis]